MGFDLGAIVVNILNDVVYLVWYSVTVHDVPYRVTVDPIKRFPEVYKVDK